MFFEIRKRFTWLVCILRFSVVQFWTCWVAHSPPRRPTGPDLLISLLTGSWISMTVWYRNSGWAKSRRSSRATACAWPGYRITLRPLMRYFSFFLLGFSLHWTAESFFSTFLIFQECELVLKVLNLLGNITASDDLRHFFFTDKTLLDRVIGKSTTNHHSAIGKFLCFTIDRLIDCLPVSSVWWSLEWLIDWLIVLLFFAWLIDWLIDWSWYCSFAWLIDWLIDWSWYCSFAWLYCWLLID